jgi:hypothetical protein
LEDKNKLQLPLESVNAHGHPIAVVRTPCNLPASLSEVVRGTISTLNTWRLCFYVSTAFCNTSLHNSCLNRVSKPLYVKCNWCMCVLKEVITGKSWCGTSSHGIDTSYSTVYTFTSRNINTTFRVCQPLLIEVANFLPQPVNTVLRNQWTC